MLKSKNVLLLSNIYIAVKHNNVMNTQKYSQQLHKKRLLKVVTNFQLHSFYLTYLKNFEVRTWFPPLIPKFLLPTQRGDEVHPPVGWVAKYLGLRGETKICTSKFLSGGSVLVDKIHMDVFLRVAKFF